MKLDTNTILIGGVVLVGVVVIGLHMGWFHGLLHMNDTQRFTDRTLANDPGYAERRAARDACYAEGGSDCLG